MSAFKLCLPWEPCLPLNDVCLKLTLAVLTYLLRPSLGPPADLGPPSSATVVDGPVVSEVRLQWSGSNASGSASQQQPVQMAIRLVHGMDEASGSQIELETRVGPVFVGNGGREITMRVSVPSIKSGGRFATDANGLDMLERVRTSRKGDADAGVSVASNFYPCTSRWCHFIRTYQSYSFR